MWITNTTCEQDDCLNIFVILYRRRNDFH